MILVSDMLNVFLVILLLFTSGSGHPLETIARDQHDRVGDVPPAPVIGDERVHFEYANSTLFGSNQQQANTNGTGGDVAFPSESTDNLSTKYSSSEPSIGFPEDDQTTPLNRAVTASFETLTSPWSTATIGTTRKSIVTFPLSSNQTGDSDEAEIETYKTTTLEPSVELFMPSKPLREPDSILIPSIDATGKPLCLSNPSDTFCESVPEYPKAELKKDIHLSPIEFRELFGVKEIDGRKMYQDEEDVNEERVCRRTPKVIYPQMARNQAKQWVYVVNDVEYIQAVVSEVCEKPDKPCAYLDHNLPPGVYSSCRQKFAFRRLMAIHPTEKRTYTDTFQFPSCCACYVKSPGFGRSGDGGGHERRRRHVNLPWM